MTENVTVVEVIWKCSGLNRVFCGLSQDLLLATKNGNLFHSYDVYLIISLTDR